MTFASKRLLACASSLCLAVSALAVETAFVPPAAQALSVDCAGFSLSIVDGNNAISTGGFTFEAGERITFNIIIPPGGGTVRIIFLGIDQQISTTGSLTFTVPNTGPTASGSFTIIISGVQGGEQAQISGVCAGAVGGGGAVNNANVSAVLVDAAALGVLPGGQGGGLNDAFGINLSAALFEEALRRIPREPERTPEEVLDDEILGLEFQLERLFAESSEIDDTLSPPLLFGAINQPEPLSEAQQEALRARRDEINEEIKQVRDALDDAITRRNALGTQASNFGPMSGQTVPLDQSAALGILRNGFGQRADLAGLRRALHARRMALGFGPNPAARPVERLPGLLGDDRFNAWLESSVTFHRVDGGGRDETGHTLAVAGGFSYLFTDNMEAGLVGRFAHSQRDGALADTDVDVWSVGAFAQGVLDNGVALQAVLAASFGDGAVVLDPAATQARGSFDLTAYQAQVQASRRFDHEAWWVEPHVSLTVSRLERDGFTASDGSIVEATRSTRLTAAVGPRVGTDRELDNGLLISPYVGAQLFLTAVDQTDRATPLASADTSLGASVSAGASLAFHGGASLSVDASLSRFEQQASDVAVSARFALPIGVD